MALEFKKIFIDGLLLIRPDVFADERGYFFESYNQKKYMLGEPASPNESRSARAEADRGELNPVFVQDNISKSVKGTIRGLHYQIGASAQGKLCSVVFGRVLDVAVDIRFGSPTFGKHYSVELSEENKFQLWIPTGFAHGFSVLSDEAIFSYKCTAPYDKQNERSILFNDPDLNIDWKVKNKIISSKDLSAAPFKKIDKDFIY